MLRRLTRAVQLAVTPATLAAALVAAPLAAASVPRVPRVYAGSTSQDAPIAIELTRDHRHLVRLLEHVTAPCPDGQRLVQTGSAPFVAHVPSFIQANTLLGNSLPKSGHFRVSGLAAEQYGDLGVGALHETLTGTVSGTRARGTYRVSIQLRSADGSPGPTCTTGTLTWKAEASPGHVFAGTTAAGLPVVLRTSADRSGMRDVRIGWGVGCVPDGSFVYPEHFSDFPMSSTGHFGDSFDEGPTTESDGSTDAFHYDLAGTAGATKASGTFAAKATFTDPSGAQRTCTQPTERWTATS